MLSSVKRDVRAVALRVMVAAQTMRDAAVVFYLREPEGMYWRQFAWVWWGYWTAVNALGSLSSESRLLNWEEVRNHAVERGEEVIPRIRTVCQQFGMPQSFGEVESLLDYMASQMDRKGGEWTIGADTAAILSDQLKDLVPHTPARKLDWESLYGSFPKGGGE